MHRLMLVGVALVSLAACGGGGTDTGGGDGGSGSADGGTGDGGGGSTSFSGAVFPDYGPASANAHQPDLVVDAAGVTHLVYTGFTKNNANVDPVRYGECTANCQQAGAWVFTTLGNVGYMGGQAHLAVGADGRVHVVWTEQESVDGQATLHYATCAGGCTNPSAWQQGAIEVQNGPSTPAPFLVYGHSLALDAQGHPRVVYRREWPHEQTLFAQCDANCTQPSSWTAVQLNTAPAFAAELVYQGGVAHLIATYLDTILYYQTCAGGCTAAGSWSVPAPTFFSSTRWFSLTFDAQGRPRLLFNQGTASSTDQAVKANDRTLNYAWCDANCTSGTSWAGYTMPIGLDTGKDGLVLAHDADGRPVMAVEKANSEVLVATCTGGCETTNPTWVGQTIDSPDLLSAATPPPEPTCDPGYAPAAYWYPGDSVRLALDAGGNPRLAYEAYVLQQCGGGTTAEALRLTRYAQVPRQQ